MRSQASAWGGVGIAWLRRAAFWCLPAALGAILGCSGESAAGPDLAPAEDPDHELFICVLLSGEGAALPGEIEQLTTLEDQLEEAVRAGGGTFGRMVLRDGRCSYYLYGRDADRIYESIVSVLETAAIVRGGYAIRRYGGAGSREERVDL